MNPHWTKEEYAMYAAENINGWRCEWKNIKLKNKPRGLYWFKGSFCMGGVLGEGEGSGFNPRVDKRDAFLVLEGLKNLKDTKVYVIMPSNMEGYIIRIGTRNTIMGTGSSLVDAIEDFCFELKETGYTRHGQCNRHIGQGKL